VVMVILSFSIIVLPPCPLRPGGLFRYAVPTCISDERHILAQSRHAPARRWLRSLKDAVSSRIGSMHAARTAVHGPQMTAPASISMPNGWTRVQKKAGESCSPAGFSAGSRAVPRRSWHCAGSWPASATWPDHCIGRRRCASGQAHGAVKLVVAHARGCAVAQRHQLDVAAGRADQLETLGMDQGRSHGNAQRHGKPGQYQPGEPERGAKRLHGP
jgi:hypothetical protein